MEQAEWGPRLVKVIAGEVRRHRTRRGMSAQALADACAALGWPIKRTVLSNLESGYRETITVPELFVIAQALEVAPLQLLLPLGYADNVEVAPGVEVATPDALRWLTGKQPLPGQQWDGGEDGSNVVASFEVHQQNVDWWALQTRSARMARDGILPGGEELARQHDRDAERTVEHLRNLRALMRARGLMPPPIPPELAHRMGEVQEP